MCEVTIIMPVYNVESYLSRSIGYIINQKFINWELILINDGSTDKSGEICELYSNRDHRISVFHQENSGSGKARQIGLNHAKGKYICFVDPDDYLDTNALYNNINIMKEYNPDLISNGYYEIQRITDNIKTKKKYIPKLHGFYDKSEFRKKFSQYELVGGRALWNKLYKKEIFEKHGVTFSDQRVGQDAIFNYEVYKVVNSVYVDSKAYYYYDNTRLGSAVKTYRSDKMQLEYNIANKYLELFQAWNLEDNYKKNILVSYWNVFFSEIVNISSKNSPLSFQDKIKRIKKIKKNKYIAETLEKLSASDVKNKFSRLNFILVKKNLFLLTIFQMRIYTFIRMKS